MLTNQLPKSLLFVITRGDSIGGGQIHVRDMARYLQNKGVRVGVAAGSIGALEKELKKTDIPFFYIKGLQRSINPIKDLLAVKELRTVIRQFKPEIVSTHTAKAGLVGRLAAFLSGIPFLFTAHGWQFAEGISAWQKLIVLFIEYGLARITPKIITVSQYDYDLALKRHIGSRAKIHLVHNGMPWLDVPALRLLNGTVTLVMVARFQEQKDHLTLFKALEQLEDMPWCLKLIGDGPDLEQWKAFVHSKGWNSRVTFYGQTLNVPQLLNESDIFVLTTHWEGFPRSILEAMRAQLPVIATDVGGVHESVIDGLTGYLVKENDIAVLSDRLKILIEDVELRLSFGKAGRQFYEKEFTFEIMMGHTQKIWKSIIN